MEYKEIRAPGFVIEGGGGYDRELALASVGAGWATLINRVFDEREKLAIISPIVQVKEKYGGLRIYTGIYEVELESLIQQVEVESYHICETCGEPGVLHKNNSGWYFTACDLHSHGAEPIPEEDDNDA